MKSKTAMAKKLNPNPPMAKTPKRRIGFLDLPAEIRNRIYEYYFDEPIWIDVSPGRTHIPKPISRPIWPAAQNPAAAVTGPAAMTQATNPTLTIAPTSAPSPLPKKQQQKPKPRRIKVYHTLGRRSIYRIPTKWSTSYGSLALTCKHINYEITPCLYSNPVFIFSSMKRLEQFISAVPPTSLACIRNVHIAAGPYGEPRLLADRVWKEKHDQRMDVVVKKAAKMMPNLERLSIRLCMIGFAPLGLNEEWLQPWLAFKLKEGASVAFKLESDMLRDTKWGNQDTVDTIWDLHMLFDEIVKKLLLGWPKEAAALEWREGTLVVSALDPRLANILHRTV